MAICGASTVPQEETLFPPLCYLEKAGDPTLEFTATGGVLTQVPVAITVNQRAATIDGLVERRKFLHLGTLGNLRSEVERELM